MHFLLNPSGLARLGEDYGWACALQWVPCGGASRWLSRTERPIDRSRSESILEERQVGV